MICRHTGITHFHGSSTVQDLLCRDVYTSVGICGSLGRDSGFSPSMHAPFLRFMDFWDGIIRCAADLAFMSKIAAVSCVLSIGQVASVWVRAATDRWSCASGVADGGSRSRGSVMLNANNAPAGSEAASVTEPSVDHSARGAAESASGEDTG